MNVFIEISVEAIGTKNFSRNILSDVAIDSSVVVV